MTVVSVNLTNGPSSGIDFQQLVFDSTGQKIVFLANATDLVSNTPSGEPHLYVRDITQNTTRLIDNNNGSYSSLSWLSAYTLCSDDIVFSTGCNSLDSTNSDSMCEVWAASLADGSTELISKHADGLESATPNGGSQQPRINGDVAVSANGRFVAFSSDANNLVTNDFNSCRDVFVRDTQSGATILASVATNGVSGAGNSLYPAISGDGRYVAFASTCQSLTTNSPYKGSTYYGAYSQIYVRDTKLGTTVMASASDTISYAKGCYANGNCDYPSISDDGRWVLFGSYANNVVSNFNYSSGYYFLFLRDTTTSATTNLGGYYFNRWSMTPDGRYVAFGASGFTQVYDTSLGSTVYSNGNNAIDVAISPDGSFLTEYSAKTILRINLSNNTTQTVSSTYVVPNSSGYSASFSRDGAVDAVAEYSSSTKQTQLSVFFVNTGTQAVVDSNSFTGRNQRPIVSPDGNWVAYPWHSTNAIGRLAYQLVLFNTLTSNKTVVASNAGDSGPFYCNPGFSRDGSVLFFQAPRTSLASGDYNSLPDVYAYSMTQLAFQTNLYRPSDTATITLSGPTFNTNYAAVDTVQVMVCSDLDSTGIPLTLTETQTNSSCFTGTLSFTSGQSSASQRRIRATDGARVWAAITDPALSNTITARALVSSGNPPVITVQPVGATNRVRSTATLQVQAFSAMTPAYQWYFNNTALPFGTNDTLVLSNLDYSQAGSYAVAVSNAFGVAASDNAVITVGNAPLITGQPQDQRARMGSTASFSFGVDGDYPLGVHWWFNQTDMESSLSFTNVQLSQAGTYYATVTNAFGSATTEAAHLWITGDSPVFGTATIKNSKLTIPLTGQLGAVYVVLQSTNLINWTTNTVLNFSATNSLMLELPAGEKQMYYQMREE